MANTFDASVRHQLRLERAKAGERKELRKLLKVLDSKIISIVEGLPQPYTKTQQDAAILKIASLVEEFYKSDVANFFVEIAKDTIDVESLYSASIISLSANVDIADINDVPKAQLLVNGFSKSVHGHKLSTWTSKLSKEKLTRIKRALRHGRSDELAKAEILKNVRRQFGISNLHAETISDLHINTFSSMTREKYDLANPDNVDVLMWSSIIDSGTTDYCYKRSEKFYDAITKEPIGHNLPYKEGPGLIHFGCRSIGIRMDRSDIKRGKVPALDKDRGGVPVSLVIRGERGG